MGWVIASLVLVPGLVLIHELGHALAILLLTGQRAVVHVGSGDRYTGPRLGPVDIRLSSDYENGGSCEILGSATARDAFFIALAGPAASCLSAIGLAVAFVTVGRPVLPSVMLGFGILVAIALCFGELLPRSTEDNASDGWHAQALWKLFHGTPEWWMPVDQPIPQDDLPSSFDRLTEATVGEAMRLNSPYVGTEHLLIAIARTDGKAGAVLRSARLSAERLRTVLRSEHQAQNPGKAPSTPAVKRVLRAAGNYPGVRALEDIAPEHLLLALLDEPSGRALQLVHALGGSPDTLRSAVMHAMPEEAARRVTRDASRDTSLAPADSSTVPSRSSGALASSTSTRGRWSGTWR